MQPPTLWRAWLLAVAFFQDLFQSLLLVSGQLFFLKQTQQELSTRSAETFCTRSQVSCGRPLRRFELAGIGTGVLTGLRQNCLSSRIFTSVATVV